MSSQLALLPAAQLGEPIPCPDGPTIRDAWRVLGLPGTPDDLRWVTGGSGDCGGVTELIMHVLGVGASEARWLLAHLKADIAAEAGPVEATGEVAQ